MQEAGQTGRSPWPPSVAMILADRPRITKPMKLALADMLYWWEECLKYSIISCWWKKKGKVCTKHREQVDIKDWKCCRILTENRNELNRHLIYEVSTRDQLVNVPLGKH